LYSDTQEIARGRLTSEEQFMRSSEDVLNAGLGKFELTRVGEMKEFMGRYIQNEIYFHAQKIQALTAAFADVAKIDPETEKAVRNGMAGRGRMGRAAQACACGCTRLGMDGVISRIAQKSVHSRRLPPLSAGRSLPAPAHARTQIFLRRIREMEFQEANLATHGSHQSMHRQRSGSLSKSRPNSPGPQQQQQMQQQQQQQQQAMQQQQHPHQR